VSGTNYLALGQPPPPDPNNPLTQGAPTLADAWQFNANAAQDWVNQQRAQSAQMGLWGPGGITSAGARAAGGQMANMLALATTAPGKAIYELNPYSAETMGLPPNLTGPEKAAINTYSRGSDYLNLNQGADAEAQRQQLDSAIGKSRLSTGTELYRGFGIPKADFDKNFQVGATVKAGPAYVSTSTDKAVGNQYADDIQPGDASVMMTIRMPKGHPALHVPTDPAIENEFGQQSEVLLPRDTRFRILDMKEKADDTYHVRAEPVVSSDNQ
jgi:hypothetical protein